MYVVVRLLTTSYVYTVTDSLVITTTVSPEYLCRQHVTTHTYLGMYVNKLRDMKLPMFRMDVA